MSHYKDTKLTSYFVTYQYGATHIPVDMTDKSSPCLPHRKGCSTAMLPWWDVVRSLIGTLSLPNIKLRPVAF